VKEEALLKGFGATIDANIFIKGTFGGFYKGFEKKYFNEAFKEELKKTLHNGKLVNWHHLLLAGYLDLKEEADYIKNNFLDSERWKKNELSSSYFESIEYSAHLALARMGDAESNQFIIQKIKERPSSDIVLRRLKELSYTKQQDSFDLIAEYLFDESVFPTTDGGITESYSNRVVHLFTNTLVGFPVKRRRGGLYSESQIKAAKEWVRNLSGDFPINKNVW
jgi:hypothetical protein